MNYEYVIISILIALAFVITLLSSWESIFKKNNPREKKIFRVNDKKRFPWNTIRVVAMFLALAASIYFGIEQKKADNETNEKERAELKHYQDSVYKAADDSINARVRRTESSIRDGLAKWGLSTDSAFQQVKRTLDTTKRTNVINLGDNPELSFCSNKNTRIDTLPFQYRVIMYVCADKAAAYDIDMEIYAVVQQKTGGYEFQNRFRPFAKGSIIPSDKRESFGYLISADVYKKLKRVYFLMKGSIKKVNVPMPIKVEDIYGLDLITKDEGPANAYMSDKIKEAIRNTGFSIE